MNAQNFKDRFGLDFLANNPDSSQEPQAESGRSIRSGATTLLSGSMEAVLASYSALILNQMKAAEKQTVSLFSLAQSTSTRVEGLLPIMHYLAERGEVELVSRDPSGNDTYRVISLVTADR